MTTTPNMNLDLPVVSVTEGPDWATLLNSAFQTLDIHDHSSGLGVKITPAGINIATDLPFNSRGATNLGYLGFALSSPPISDNVVFVDTNGSLKWKTANGEFTILDTNGSAASGGGFGGDYTSTDALATYSDVTKGYTFLQDTGITAFINSGAISLYENVASANPITIQPPNALASAYSLTLPTTQSPGDDRALVSSTAGVLSYNDQALTTTSSITFASGTLTGNLTLGTAGNQDNHTFNGRTFLIRGDASAGILDDPGAGFFSVGNRAANFLIGEGTTGGGAIQGLFINQNINFDGTNYVAHTGGLNVTQLRVGNNLGGSATSDAVVIRTNNGSATGSGVPIALQQVLSISNDGGIYTKSGSSSSVSHGFELAKNTGMWRASGGNLLFTRSGTDIFGITTNSGFAGTDNAFTWGVASFRWSDIYAVSGSVNTSDKRDKKRIEISDLGLDFLLRLEAKKFRYKRKRDDGENDPDDNRTHYGLIAQEVRQVLRDIGKNPNRVALFDEQNLTDREGKPTGQSRLGIRYSELIAPLISAVKELDTRLKALEGA